MRSYFKKKSSGSGLETEINGSGDPSRSPRDTLLPAKFGTKIRRPAVFEQPVEFARGLRATEFILVGVWTRPHSLIRDDRKGIMLF
jgi:hypothetical protein